MPQKYKNAINKQLNKNVIKFGSLIEYYPKNTTFPLISGMYDQLLHTEKILSFVGLFPQDPFRITEICFFALDFFIFNPI